MHSIARTILLVTWLTGPAVLAGPTPPPPPATPPPSKAAASPAPAAPRRINLKLQGTLREALRAIADKGGISLVITGELKDPAEVYLNDVSAEEALQIVADAHQLMVIRKGSIWTIRPLTGEERVAAAEAREEAAEDAHDEPGEDQDDSEEGASEESDPAVAMTLPVPPVPPLPPSPEVDEGEIPDPVSDPKGFQRHIEERVQRDLKAKLMRKFKGKRFSSHGGRDLVGTGHVVVEENTSVEHAVSYGGGLEVRGHVEGDAVAFGGGVHLAPTAEVEGDVVAFGGGITREAGAILEGDEIAFGDGSFGPAIAGGITRLAPVGREADDEEESSSGSSLPAFLAWFAVLFGTGFLGMMFAPNRMKLMEAELKRDPIRCGLTGLVGIPALLVLSVLLAVTVVGVLVAVPLLVLSALGLLLGLCAVANEIGVRLPLMNIRKTQAVVLAVGILVLMVVSLIPVMGPLMLVVLGLAAFGSVVRTRFGSRRQGIPEPV